jgi:hypothetical protein
MVITGELEGTGQPGARADPRAGWDGGWAPAGADPGKKPPGAAAGPNAQARFITQPDSRTMTILEKWLSKGRSFRVWQPQPQ